MNSPALDMNDTQRPLNGALWASSAPTRHHALSMKTALVNRLTSDIPDVQVAREAETETPYGVIGSLARRGA